MIIFIGLFAIGCCITMICAYYTWENARLYNAQAENMIRMANERLYEADQIWRKMRGHEYKKHIGEAKIIPFNRHLRSVPMPNEDGPNAA